MVALSIRNSGVSPRVTFRWYPVRCCCNPARIYGFLPLPGFARNFTVRDNNGQTHNVDLRPLAQPFPGTTPEQIEARKRACKNPDELHMPFQRDVELAVFADDRPLEFWRSLPGFVDVVPGHETFPQSPISGLNKAHHG